MLNEILNKNFKHPPIYRKTFIVDEKEITGPKIVVIFNKIFRNMGPDLEKSIRIQDTNKDDFLYETTVNSMFLK